MREIRMNKERAKKIGAVYYKDIHKKFQPGDYAVNASTGEVVRFPEDQKAFDELRVYHGYFVPVEPTKKYLEAYKMEQRVNALKKELRECEEMQDNLRERAHNEITKGQTHVVCVMMNRRPDEMVDPDEVIRAIGDDRLLSMGRRYNHSRESLWVALVEVDGFTERKGYYGIKNSYTLSQVGYRPGDKFHDGIDYVVFNHGERVENPVDQATIRENERKAEEECRKKAEEEMWKNIKTYDDKNETPERTKIFAYRGVLGMVTHPNAPGIVAKISNTSLGVVIKASHCDITPEAKKILSNARRESGSFAGIQLTGGDIPCIGWLGSYNLALDPKDVEIGRDCDKSTLDKMNLVETKDMVFPIGFVNYVNQEIISNNKIN